MSCEAKDLWKLEKPGKSFKGEGGLFKKIWSPQNAPAAQGLESKQFDWWNKSEDSRRVEKLN